MLRRMEHVAPHSSAMLNMLSVSVFKRKYSATLLSTFFSSSGLMWHLSLIMHVRERNVNQNDNNWNDSIEIKTRLKMLLYSWLRNFDWKKKLLPNLVATRLTGQFSWHIFAENQITSRFSWATVSLNRSIKSECKTQTECHKSSHRNSRRFIETGSHNRRPDKDVESDLNSSYDSCSFRLSCDNDRWCDEQYDRRKKNGFSSALISVHSVSECVRLCNELIDWISQ